MDDFIGTVVERGDHNYKVVSLIPETRPKRYIITCDVCSEDMELYPLGSLKSTKHHLVSGRNPCGCGKSTIHTKDQVIIRIKRVLLDSGYEFLGFIGEYKNQRTKVKIRDTYTGVENSTSTVSGLLTKGRASKTALYERSREDYSKLFHSSGRFAAGTKFYRNPLDIREWWYICPVCAKDEFVLSGTCTGVFKSSLASLKKGYRSCRCSPCFNFSMEQRELQVREVCTDNSRIFVGWEGSYSGCHTKLIWSCVHGHENRTSIDNFLRGRGCRECSSATGDGYFPKKGEYQDYLYICDVEEVYYENEYPIICNYFKVGRSFYPKRRMKELTKESKKRDGVDRKFSLVCLYGAKHDTVFSVEQDIHNNIFSDYKPVNGYGSSELLTSDIKDVVISYCDKLGVLDKTYDVRIVKENVEKLKEMCEDILPELKSFKSLKKDLLVERLDNVSGKLDNVLQQFESFYEMKQTVKGE